MCRQDSVPLTYLVYKNCPPLPSVILIVNCTRQRHIAYCSATCCPLQWGGGSKITDAQTDIQNDKAINHMQSGRLDTRSRLRATKIMYTNQCSECDKIVCCCPLASNTATKCSKFSTVSWLSCSFCHFMKHRQKAGSFSL